MPSQLHDALVRIFRNRAELAPALLRESLGVDLPNYTRARIVSADLTDVQPAEYRADHVVVLEQVDAVLGIVVEVQVSRDRHKPWVWPAYAASLRAQLRCPTCLLVFTPSERLARWASKTIELGGGNRFTASVIGPSGVPSVTEPEQAAADPELAVLSAMAHGGAPDVDKAVKIAVTAMNASLQLDPDRSMLYFDLVYASLSEAARKSLQAMDPAKYEYQSEFARRYLSQGRAEGRAEGEARGRAEGEARGRADMLLKILARKFAPLSEDVTARIRSATLDDLDRWVDRIDAAHSLDELLK